MRSKSWQRDNKRHAKINTIFINSIKIDNRIDYTLMKINKTECDTDSRFHQIYKVNEEQFYSANSALFLRDSLRGYVISS